MANNVQRALAAGFDMIQVAKLLPDGYTPGGISGSIANGASATPRRMYGAKSANPQIPEPTVVTVTGDDTRLGIFTFDSDAAPSFPLSVAEMDQQISSNSQGSNIYTVGSYYDLNMVGVVNRDFPSMMTWFSTQGKASASNNASGFYNLVMPNTTMTYLGRNFEERGAAAFGWNVVVNPFDTLPWGTGNLDDSSAFGKKSAFMFEWVTNKRPQLLVIKDDTTTDTYQLDYVPWTDGNGNVRFIAWRNGVVVGQTGSTGAVSVSANKTVTLGAGLTGRTAGDTIFIFAEQA